MLSRASGRSCCTQARCSMKTTTKNNYTCACCVYQHSKTSIATNCTSPLSSAGQVVVVVGQCKWARDTFICRAGLTCIPAGKGKLTSLPIPLSQPISPPSSPISFSSFSSSSPLLHPLFLSCLLEKKEERLRYQNQNRNDLQMF